MRIRVTKNSVYNVKREGNKIISVLEDDFDWVINVPKKLKNNSLVIELECSSYEVMEKILEEMSFGMGYNGTFNKLNMEVAVVDIILSKNKPKTRDLVFKFEEYQEELEGWQDQDQDCQKYVQVVTNNNRTLDLGCWKYDPSSIVTSVYTAGYRFMTIEYEEDDIVALEM